MMKHFLAKVGGRALFVEYDKSKWLNKRYLKVHAYLVGDPDTYAIVPLTRDEKLFVEQLIGEHVRTGKIPAMFSVESSKGNPSRRNPSEFPRGAFVIGIDNKKKRVKNLGWLMRNWKGVDYFTAIRSESKLPASEAFLTALMRDGSRFESDFASFDVLLGHFLDRPVFRGADIFIIDRGAEMRTTIGSPAYRRLITGY